jgi:hypothetical protein
MLPWSVVVEVPVVEPMAMFVVEPETPAVPMLTALVVAVRVAPVARLRVDAAVVPPIEVVEAPRTGPRIVVVVEPETPPVPMFRVLVEALMVAPEATLIVPVAVELPRVCEAFEKVMLPDTVWVSLRVISCLVEALMRAKTAPVVVQMSPLTGEVGATPCGRLRPAVPVAEASVVTSPVNVAPASGA